MGLKVNNVNLSTTIDQLARLRYSSYLWAALIAYLMGQLIKIVLLYRRNPHLTFRDFFASGNMPSTHTASTCSDDADADRWLRRSSCATSCR